MKADLPDRLGDVYHGRVLLVSGATGFLGKVLIEKLLRCTEVKTIYMLIRNKKGKTPNERVADIFSNPLFNLLKETKPETLKKCKPICGDVTEENLGISPNDRQLLRNEVQMIFHSAATTRFDDTMKYAVKMNTRGTKFMLDLANECKNLKIFVHVSTAYAFPKEKILYEKVYEPPADPHEVINSINWLNEEAVSNLTQQLLGDVPNTYTFTKALAEGLVNEQVGKLPVIIVRPAIVVPIYQDPLPGWTNNLQGPTGLFVGAGKGVIRSMYLNSKAHANFMPADITINCMMVAAWDYLERKRHHIYNLTTPNDEIIVSWEEIINIGKEVVYTRMPFNQILWYPGGNVYSNRLVHNINFYLFQIIPAIIVDILLVCLGYKRFLYQVQRRIQKGGEMFEYYTTKAWDFDNQNAKEGRSHLNALERKKYKLDTEGVVLHDYFENCIHAARLYILKETDDMLPAARRTMKIMYFVDKICKTLIVFGILYYLYKLFLMPVLEVRQQTL